MHQRVSGYAKIYSINYVALEMYLFIYFDSSLNFEIEIRRGNIVGADDDFEDTWFLQPWGIFFNCRFLLFLHQRTQPSPTTWMDRSLFWCGCVCGTFEHYGKSTTLKICNKIFLLPSSRPAAILYRFPTSIWCWTLLFCNAENGHTYQKRGVHAIPVVFFPHAECCRVVLLRISEKRLLRLCELHIYLSKTISSKIKLNKWSILSMFIIPFSNFFFWNFV